MVSVVSDSNLSNFEKTSAPLPPPQKSFLSNKKYKTLIKIKKIAAIFNLPSTQDKSDTNSLSLLQSCSLLHTPIYYSPLPSTKIVNIRKLKLLYSYCSTPLWWCCHQGASTREQKYSVRLQCPLTKAKGKWLLCPNNPLLWAKNKFLRQQSICRLLKWKKTKRYTLMTGGSLSELSSPCPSSRKTKAHFLRIFVWRNKYFQLLVLDLLQR